jgi:hypothetical protein
LALAPSDANGASQSHLADRFYVADTSDLQQFELPMAVPPHHFDDEPADTQPGGLLGELERRQDDVLSQLDDLDAKLSDVLKGLEPTPAKDIQDKGLVAGNAGEIGEDDGDDFEDTLSLEDWA